MDIYTYIPGSFNYTPFCLYAHTPKSGPREARGARTKGTRGTMGQRQRQNQEAKAKGTGREARGKPPGPARTYKKKPPGIYLFLLVSWSENLKIRNTDLPMNR